MKIAIALIASKVVLTFVTPGPGSYYIIRHDSPWQSVVVLSGHETNACHVSVQAPSADAVGILTLEFYPGWTNPK